MDELYHLSPLVEVGRSEQQQTVGDKRDVPFLRSSYIRKGEPFIFVIHTGNTLDMTSTGVTQSPGEYLWAVTCRGCGASQPTTGSSHRGNPPIFFLTFEFLSA